MRPKIILDTRKQITTGPDKGRFHIKIKVRFKVNKDGQNIWIPRGAKTGVYATPEEFAAMPKTKSKVLQDKWDKVSVKFVKATGLCKPSLTPDLYISLMDGSGNFESVTGMFDYYIAECLKEDASGEARDGNAKVLTNARDFFIRYKGSDHIAYAEITKEWLDNCKKWAMAIPVSMATFSMYVRALRTIMNMAGHEPFNKIDPESIPFGKGKGKFKASGGKKKRKIKLELPLNELIEEKKKILNFVGKRKKVKPKPGEPEEIYHHAMNMYLNYWKASFFGNGANMADVLRWKIGEYDQEKSIIMFERKKTANTEEDNAPIDILVGEELKAIIAKEGNRSLDPTEYIFPVLKKGMSSAERKQAIFDFTVLMNRSLKRAAKAMGLKIKLSSGSARYLLATILDRSGIPKSVIKDLLGHESEDMQSHYTSPYWVDMRKTILKLLAG